MDRTTATHPRRSKAGSRKIGKYFRRATTFSIPARTYGPGHDRGFSGPLVPGEARRRGQKGGGGVAFDVDREPTSPKVSCMGRVKKHREEMCRLAPTRGRENRRDWVNEGNNNNNREKKSSSSSSAHSMIFKGKFRRAEKEPPPVAPVQAPPIGQMKRFASGRDQLGGFDWKVNNIYGGDEKSYCGAKERANEGEEEEEEDEWHERKKVNSWRRRATKPPSPLQHS